MAGDVGAGASKKDLLRLSAGCTGLHWGVCVLGDPSRFCWMWVAVMRQPVHDLLT